MTKYILYIEFSYYDNMQKHTLGQTHFYYIRVGFPIFLQVYSQECIDIFFLFDIYSAFHGLLL